jgi:hypothetical protein
MNANMNRCDWRDRDSENRDYKNLKKCSSFSNKNSNQNLNLTMNHRMVLSMKNSWKEKWVCKRKKESRGIFKKLSNKGIYPG